MLCVPFQCLCIFLFFFVVGMTWMYDPICRKLIHGWKVILLEEVAELAMANQVDNFYWVFYFCLSKKWSSGKEMNYRVECKKAKTTWWQIVAFAEIIERLDGPCSKNFWLCSFSKPYIALMWRKLLKWVLKAKLLVIVQLCRSCKSFDEFRTKAIQNFPILLSSSFFYFLPKATQN